MRKRRLTLAASICTAAMLFPGSPANAGPPPTGTSPSAVEAGSANMDDLPHKAANSVAAMEKQVNIDAFIAKKDKPDSRLKGLPVKPAAQKSADGVATSAREMAQSMANGPKGARFVDKVRVKVNDVAVKKQSNGSLVVTAQIEISRHIAKDDVNWEGIIPHEIKIDARGCIYGLVVKDRDYYDKHLVSYLPKPQKDASNSPKGRRDDKSQYTGEKLAQGQQRKAPAVVPLTLTQKQKKKAVEYARKHAKFPNRKYHYYKEKEGGDCTNFVSQAMEAGGWEQVSHPYLDYKDDNAWWYGGGLPFSYPLNSWTWSGAENFFRMANGSGGLKRTTLLNNFYELQPGDILQYKAKGATEMTHTMIVTKVENGEPYLSYHTDDQIDQPLSSMLKGEKKTWYPQRT